MNTTHVRVLVLTILFFVLGSQAMYEVTDALAAPLGLTFVGVDGRPTPIARWTHALVFAVAALRIL